MRKDGRVLTQLRYCLWMHLWKVFSWFYHMVFPVAQKVQWCHYKSIRYPSWWIMLADLLYVFCAVLSSLFSQGDYVLEGLMPETHYFLWLNRDPCTSHLEPSEKKGVGLFSLSGSLGSTYLPLECSWALLELCICWSEGLETGKFSECSAGRIADCKFG